MEIHAEFRQCVIQNEQRLRQFAVDLFPKEDAAPLAAAESNVDDDIQDLPVEFTEQELQAATVIDPNQVYVSSSDEDEEDGDEEEPEQENEVEGDEDKAGEEQMERQQSGQPNGQSISNTGAILVSDDDGEDEEDYDEDADMEEGELNNNHGFKR